MIAIDIYQDFITLENSITKRFFQANYVELKLREDDVTNELWHLDCDFGQSERNPDRKFTFDGAFSECNDAMEALAQWCSYREMFPSGIDRFDVESVNGYNHLTYPKA